MAENLQLLRESPVRTAASSSVEWAVVHPESAHERSCWEQHLRFTFSSLCRCSSKTFSTGVFTGSR